jgi:hypothetical protein
LQLLHAAGLLDLYHGGRALRFAQLPEHPHAHLVCRSWSPLELDPICWRVRPGLQRRTGSRWTHHLTAGSLCPAVPPPADNDGASDISLTSCTSRTVSPAGRSQVGAGWPSSCWRCGEPGPVSERRSR